MRKTNIVLLVFVWLTSSLAVQAQDFVVGEGFFKQVDELLRKCVKDGKIDYAMLHADPTELLEVCKFVDNADLSQSDDLDKKAFYINAYNLAVIKAVVLNHPISSPLDVPGFFDKEKHKIAGEYMTLNHLENKVIRPTYNDPRVHFVLVCGAVDCPPITNFAYQPYRLQQQLDMQTKKALNNPSFIKKVGDGIQLSQIFEWYQVDFGKNLKDVVKYINQYRDEPIDAGAKLSYYNYDWSLNQQTGTSSVSNGGGSAADVPSSANRLYLVSSLMERGQWELKVFNNLYTQASRTAEGVANSRYNFFTTTPQFLFGINTSFNVGFDMRLRSVYADFEEATSPLEVLKFRRTEAFRNEGGSLTGYSRIGLAALGPKIKYLPFKKIGNVSIQHTLYIPTGRDLTGGADSTDDKEFFDFNGFDFLTQIFYDQSMGNDFSLFVSTEIFLENLFADSAPNLHVPAKVIVSYFKGKLTTYSILDITGRWRAPLNKNLLFREFAPYAQTGIGVKYQILPNFEIESLVTKFFATDLNVPYNGKAATFNIGFRITK